MRGEKGGRKKGRAREMERKDKKEREGRKGKS